MFHREREFEPLKSRRARALRKTYGMTLEQYDVMLAAQNGVCAICQLPESQGENLAVDHDHDSKINRALLCRNCNIAIGNFKEDPDRVQRAVEYLRKWKAV